MKKINTIKNYFFKIFYFLGLFLYIYFWKKCLKKMVFNIKLQINKKIKLMYFKFILLLYKIVKISWIVSLLFIYLFMFFLIFVKVSI